jgi:hypothetical protein
MAFPKFRNSPILRALRASERKHTNPDSTLTSKVFRNDPSHFAINAPLHPTFPRAFPNFAITPTAAHHPINSSRPKKSCASTICVAPIQFPMGPCTTPLWRLPKRIRRPHTLETDQAQPITSRALAVDPIHLRISSKRTALHEKSYNEAETCMQRWRMMKAFGTGGCRRSNCRCWSSVMEVGFRGDLCVTL